MQVNGLVLAAGMSSRMGAFKPLLPLGGKTVIECTVDSLLAGGAAQVTVVLGRRAPDVAALLQKRYPPNVLTLAVNAAYETTDMLASVKLGLRALPPCGAFFLLPGDIPAVAPATCQALVQHRNATGARVVFPVYRGKEEHPPLVAAGCIKTILEYAGEGGLRGVWRQFAGQTARLPVNDIGCAMDTDTPADYDRLAAYLQNRRG
ncbi:MAG: nucleotidyltransferase family protein [Ruminococcaceae bacterium]|nr:nucleotidyltransferase family protein [Oscillospiraceae bacterium]